MITCSSMRMGRLGNQMFQYATLYAIGRRTGFKVAVDWPEGREYFGIDSQPPDRRPSNRFVRIARYDPEAFRQPDGTDFMGLYQSEKYFLACREEILHLYLPKEEYRRQLRAMREGKLVEGKPTIVCHVRGRDYFRWGWPIPGARYYADALSMICGRDHFRIDDYNLVVTTNDRSLAEQIFRDFPTAFFSEESALVDMMLMSTADRCVLSASSFSWWGAWLNTTPNRIVVGPLHWYRRILRSAWCPRDIRVNGWEYLKVREMVNKRWRLQRILHRAGWIPRLIGIQVSEHRKIGSREGE